MKKILFSKGWMLSAPGVERNPSCSDDKMHGSFAEIDLPNDYSIYQPRDPDAPGGASNGFFRGGRGTYVKYFKADPCAERFILEIGGAYMVSSVFLNEDFLMQHAHGYAPYLVDLTSRIDKKVTNKLVIYTDDMQPSTRWYSGAGLYRDVYLWTGGGVRIEPRDVFVSTPDLSSVHVSCTVTADRYADIKVSTQIRDADGKISASSDTFMQLTGEGKFSSEWTVSVPGARVWSQEDPYLYTAELTVSEGDKILDTFVTTFGIRTITADPVHGLRLNGKTVKLRGGCIHHDHGVLGAADYPAAAERKVRLLKEAGFNALRTAHNPPSEAFLDVCDRLGIVVMDEAFDVWNVQKRNNDYHLFFADRYAKDIEEMVCSARNHPCVFSYSVGNEIIERDGSSDGAAWSAKLAGEIRRWDNTRFVTSGVCGMWPRHEFPDPDDYKEAFYKLKTGENGRDDWACRTEGYMAPLDIVGYNYAYTRYAKDHAAFPERVIWGSETHAIHFYDSWKTVLENDHVVGDFTWTAYDNIGEAGTGRSCWARDGVIKGISLAEYPWRTCWQGDLDLCGYRRPQSYFREAVWIGGTEPRIFTTHPEHAGEGFTGTEWHWYDVLDTWTFEDKYIGKPVKCEVYTDADEIEWILNGRTVCRSTPVKAIAAAEIPYEKGTLTAVAFKEGKEYGRSSLSTVGKISKIKSEAEKDIIFADNRDLCYFRITVTDEQGERVPDAKVKISARCEGGCLFGIFSGDPKNEDEYGTDTCHTFEGRALAVVRTDKPGTVVLTVSAEGLNQAESRVEAKYN